MAQLFGSLAGLFKPEVTNIDNNVFRLHYKFTVIVLIVFGLLVAGLQFIGDPIDCMSIHDVPTNLLDTYCWMQTTFSVEDVQAFKKVGEEIPYPGVSHSKPGEKRVYPAYYQWVCFVLFLQAILFHIPRYFWKAVEAGRVEKVILGLNSSIMPQDQKRDNRKLLAEYLDLNRSNHNICFAAYVLAEVMNFVNVVGQIFLMDSFLGGAFLTYGWKGLQFTEWDWTLRDDPMIKVFPRLTKCTLHRYGASGLVQRHNLMCILPINIINEKIYIFLLFWFVILAILSGLVLVYRAAMVLWPRARLIMLQYRSRMTDKNDLPTVVDRLGIGDRFILNLLAKNLDPFNFRDLITECARRRETKHGDDM